ncbi:PhnA-like protein [Flaviflagellibacter deserti]|jgi:hypothetical protein|uniref:PhnA-like protein n=1 Tax=Flaviflagellibacter deserti TaxID=2267266 RepID=A0ABV9Z0Y3_9HYPH
MAHIDTPRGMGAMDAPHRSPVSPAEDIRTVAINQISWSAVFAGVVTALALHVILNLLGLGIGAATIEPTTGETPDAQTFSIGAGIWWTVSGILASLAGGYVAGRTSGKPKGSTAGFHGFASWATTTLVIFYMITTSAGALVGGLYSTVSGVVEQHAGQAAQTAANTPDPVGRLRGQVQQMTGQDPNNPSPEAKQRAAEAADATATAVSTGGIFAAVALLLGAAAGFMGGRMGAVDPTITTARLAGTGR